MRCRQDMLGEAIDIIRALFSGEQPDAALVYAWHRARQAASLAGDVCRRNPFRAPGDVADSIPCGPDLDAIVDAVGAYWAAGFADVALIQIGGEAQELFLKEAAEPLLAALHDAAR